VRSRDHGLIITARDRVQLNSCRVLDPEYLKAERDKDYERAVELLERMPLILLDGWTQGIAG